MNTPKRILVAFDDSEASMNSVQYLGRVTTLASEKVVLFHVYSPLPDYYFDMEEYSDAVLYSERFREATHWDCQSRIQIQEKLAAAQRILIDAGFLKDRVELKIVDRKVGFARDIIEEARHGYDLVVIGRKITCNLCPVSIGGVTFKLLQQIDFIPLLIVGEAPVPDKALLALDGSDCATSTLRTVGTWLVRSDFEISLIHVIRATGTDVFMQIASEWDEDIIRSAKKDLSTFPVKTKILSGQRSRFEAIINEAGQGEFGTIVVGRKGLSDVKIFYSGRVCHKMVQTAQTQAIWVGV